MKGLTLILLFLGGHALLFGALAIVSGRTSIAFAFGLRLILIGLVMAGGGWALLEVIQP